MHQQAPLCDLDFVWNLMYPFGKRLLSGRVPDNNFLLSGRVPDNNFLLSEMVPDNNFLLSENPLKCPQVLAEHASGCWLSALGAGVPYNREENENNIFFFQQWHIFYINSQPSSDSSLTKVPSLHTTGSPHGTEFPTTSGKILVFLGHHLGGL